MIRTPAGCLVLVSALLMLPVHRARAQVFVVPSANAVVEGTATVSPLSNSALTEQWVYGASTISLPTGAVITGLSYRLDGGQSTGPSAAITISNYQITLSPSNNAPGLLSTTFADNIGPGAVLVHLGAVTVAPNSFS